jgi:hypothetical protein
MKTALLAISIGILLAGCASSPPKQDNSITAPAEHSKSSKNEAGPQSQPADFESMQKRLGLHRDFHELGYAEKPFDNCETESGESTLCRRQFMVVIHFQLLCRDSEGTVSEVLSRSDMKPISERQVNWNLKGNAGDIQTDSSGFGQIRTIASVSPRGQRLKLAVGNETLYLKAGEITRVVTPKPWCNPE